MTTVRDLKIDEARHAWIVAHQGVSTIQRRRAEVLARQLRTRTRRAANAAGDPHDDTIIPPLWLRVAKSPASHIEMLVVLAAALVAPAGWLGGLALKRAIAARIPHTLRAFPVTALLWSGVLVGLSVLALYRPSASIPQIVLAPWLCVQLAAIPAAAGIYGIADGWLAIASSDLWWPLTLPKRSLTAAEASAILGDFDAPASVSTTTEMTCDLDERHRA